MFRNVLGFKRRYGTKSSNLKRYWVGGKMPDSRAQFAALPLEGANPS
jgi:hypothetical protein